MGCLSDDDALAFARGTLRGPALATAEQHVAECPSCRRVVAEALRYFAGESESRARAAAAGAASGGRPLRPGERVARFEIGELIGAGASGMVYRARDPQLERDVAVKLVRPELSGGADAESWRQRFLFEAQAMARLQHPNVVVIHEAGVLPERGESFIAMELVEGKSLARWLAERPRDLPEVIDMFLQVARGLAAAHAAGLVHGDFKPENVLVGGDGRPRITDFGLARPAATHAPGGSGTLLYMAPESLRGGAADARTDQFAFCVALYVALYGRHPFADEGATPLDLTAAVMSGEVRRPAPYHGVPLEVFEVLARGLRPEAADRHASMEAFAGALSTAIRRARGRVLRRRILIASAGALVGALVVGGVWRAVEGPRCGNGRVEEGEQCDDGNRSGADGCVACRFARCGDGHVRAHVEECDDGNTRDGDGCSATCVACTGSSCAPGWSALPGSSRAFRLFSENVNWDQARERCAERRAHLATLEERAEHDFVAPWATRSVWIGATDREQEGEFRWVTGRPVGFSRFAPGEPDDANGESDCAALDSDAFWHDRPCRDRNAFVCEVD